jgi:hypothetical protein
MNEKNLLLAQGTIVIEKSTNLNKVIVLQVKKSQNLNLLNILHQNY